jgi:hypothetical protein
MGRSLQTAGRQCLRLLRRSDGSRFNGNVAYRVGQKLNGHPKKLRATNRAAADQFIQHHYRKGWKI